VEARSQERWLHSCELLRAPELIPLFSMPVVSCACSREEAKKDFMECEFQIQNKALEGPVSLAGTCGLLACSAASF